MPPHLNHTICLTLRLTFAHLSNHTYNCTSVLTGNSYDQHLKTYTYSQARQSLAELLDRAAHEGAARIRRRDGRIFIILPEQATTSSLDVAGVDLGLTTDDIVAFIHESRRPPT